MPAMTKFEELTVTLPDGYGAYARFWRPEAVRGAILHHHGIQSHCDWYAGSAERLCEAGYAVLQIDRRGSGRNEVDRGHAESAPQLVADAHAARDVLLERTGLDRYHVVGVSWGGKLAVVAYIDDPARVASLTLVTPGLFPRVGVSKEEAHTIGVAMIYEPETFFDIPLNDPDLFTHSAKWREFHATDPRTLSQCTAAFYLASRRMDKTLARLADRPPVPIHLMTAGEEGIVDNQKTIEYIISLGWKGTRLTHYERSRHSVEFDEPDRFYADLVSFVEQSNSATC